MSKLLLFSTFVVTLAAAVAIASLVLNIIILSNTNSIKTTPTPNIVNNIDNSTSVVNNTNNTTNNNITTVNQCGSGGSINPYTSTGIASNTTGFAAAGAYLLNGLDLNIDPCDDFYAFTCNKYLGSIDLDQLQLSRKGTYDDSQVIVNKQINTALQSVTDKSSLTERITKKAVDACVASADPKNIQNLNAKILKDITNTFGGIPFLGQNLKTNVDLFSAAGQIEQQHALGTLFFSWSSIDYKQVSKNALYISQPDLSMPRDYYVKPQFSQQLQGRKDTIVSVMSQFAADAGKPVTSDAIEKAAEDVTNFEVQIALASWPDELMRNYELQYNRYLLKDLDVKYPTINWDTYLAGLFSGIQTPDQISTDGVVLSQPSYFSWLESIFAGNLVDKKIIANYMIVNWLMDDAGFWGPMGEHAKHANYIPYAMRRGKGVTRVGRRHIRKYDDDDIAVGCLDMLMAYMPYGPGYVYIKAQANRDAVVADVKRQTDLIIGNFQGMIGTLGWMTNDTKQQAYNKAANLYKNFGWPVDLFGDFKDTTTIDNYNQDYRAILDYDVTDFYDILLVLKKGMEVREAFRLLNQPGDRSNFLQSPAMVNAWYQPERNSITFPYAAWNPPYYRFDFPQAYNFAGQGGTGGHELTHGYDDEGVQFGPHGELSPCSWNRCGWMDDTSSNGFNDMAQCVVSQFNTQCCPLKTGNVHCANGATTQGENIADLGGQQAAYLAYQQFISTDNNGVQELRLPGMEQFSPNQIFWITYGYSWCMKQTDANMVKQLLTNPHAPAQCRTNQVMQDIPAFGKDFNCRAGSKMFPTSDQRCKVWVGY